MRFWFRELAGWVLVLLGLACFAIALAFCTIHYLFEAWVAAIIGIFVFRGGIHLLKVAVAARVCMQAQKGPDLSFRADHRTRNDQSLSSLEP
jgi:hypothetical protein